MYTLDITNAEVRDMFCDLVRGWFAANQTDYNGFVHKNAYILEFKVFNARREQTLEDTVRDAYAKIEEKQYEAALTAKGIPSEHIHKYGFDFEGKKVLIG